MNTQKLLDVQVARSSAAALVLLAAVALLLPDIRWAMWELLVAVPLGAYAMTVAVQTRNWLLAMSTAVACLLLASSIWAAGSLVWACLLQGEISMHHK